jgi:hypothetical protein
MGKVLRDAALIPALGEIMDRRWWPAVDAMVDVLAEGRDQHGARRRDLHGALRVAVDLRTWEILTRDGLDDRAAASLAARMVHAAAAGPDPRSGLPDPWPRDGVHDAPGL